jgi:hypothetical protein
MKKKVFADQLYGLLDKIQGELMDNDPDFDIVETLLEQALRFMNNTPIDEDKPTAAVH